MNFFQDLFLVLLAFSPGIFWAYYFIRFDWRRPEPPGLIIQIFLWGIVMGFFALLIEKGELSYIFPSLPFSSFLFIVLRAFLVAGLIEEGLKYLLVRLLVYHRKVFDEPLDGLVYCMTVALGLATFENVAAVFIQGTTAILIRFLTTTLMHALTAGVMGYFMGLAKFNLKKEKLYLFLSLFLAIVLHGIYNVIAQINLPFGLLSLALWLILMYIITLELIREAESKYSKLFFRKFGKK